MKLDKITSDNTKNFNYFDMKIPDPTSNIPSSSYDQPSDDLIKWSLLKSPEKYSHASQFTKHIYCMTLEDDNILKIKKWLGVICSAFC